VRRARHTRRNYRNQGRNCRAQDRLFRRIGPHGENLALLASLAGHAAEVALRVIGTDRRKLTPAICRTAPTFHWGGSHESVRRPFRPYRRGMGAGLQFAFRPEMESENSLTI